MIFHHFFLWRCETAGIWSNRSATKLHFKSGSNQKLCCRLTSWMDPDVSHIWKRNHLTWAHSEPAEVCRKPKRSGPLMDRTVLYGETQTRVDLQSRCRTTWILTSTMTIEIWVWFINLNTFLFHINYHNEIIWIVQLHWDQRCGVHRVLSGLDGVPYFPVRSSSPFISGLNLKIKFPSGKEL